MMRERARGFTLMELMVVVVLVGIIAAFAIPNYQKAVRRGHERDMIMQLTALHGGCEIYKAKTGAYWTGSISDLPTINETFQINIISLNDETSYEYQSPFAGPGTYRATATWSGTTIGVDQNPIDAANNPFCIMPAGNCLIAP